MNTEEPNVAKQKPAPKKCRNHNHLKIKKKTATENAFAWILDTKNVIWSAQRYDAISIVRMISPTYFLVVSHFGNEGPTIGRFLAVSDALMRISTKIKEKPVVSLSKGKGYVVWYDGEFGRAVYISKGKTNPAYHRFALMDLHVVIDVPLSDVYELPLDVNPLNVPSNMFLVRIHGVGPVENSVFHKYSNRFNDADIPMNTPCVIRNIDQTKCLWIDFILDGRWISETLLEKKEAARIYIDIPRRGKGESQNEEETKGEWICLYCQLAPFNLGKNIATNPLPEPKVVQKIVKEMVKGGTYNFPNNGAICDTADVCYIRPNLYPCYHNVVKKLCPESRISDETLE